MMHGSCLRAQVQGAHAIIPAGTLDDGPSVKPVVHIQVAPQASAASSASTNTIATSKPVCCVIS